MERLDSFEGQGRFTVHSFGGEGLSHLPPRFRRARIILVGQCKRLECQASLGIASQLLLRHPEVEAGLGSLVGGGIGGDELTELFGGEIIEAVVVEIDR